MCVCVCVWTSSDKLESNLEPEQSPCDRVPNRAWRLVAALRGARRGCCSVGPARFNQLQGNHAAAVLRRLGNYVAPEKLHLLRSQQKQRGRAWRPRALSTRCLSRATRPPLAECSTAWRELIRRSTVAVGQRKMGLSPGQTGALEARRLPGPALQRASRCRVCRASTALLACASGAR